MGKEWQFAWYAIRKNFVGSIEMRASFLTTVFGMILNDIAFVLIWTFFVQTVGVIHGWGATEIFGLMGFSALVYGIVFFFSGGIAEIASYVEHGNFDRFLVSPKNILLRIAVSSSSVSAIGDILFGITGLVLFGVGIEANILQWCMLVFLLGIGVIVFLGMQILVFSVSFFFVDARAMTRGLFEVFMTPSLFHGGLFQGTMRFVFIFCIPSLLIGGLPIEIVRDISWKWFFISAALATFWFLLAVFVFSRAVRKYESSNLMTFGG